MSTRIFRSRATVRREKTNDFGVQRDNTFSDDPNVVAETLGENVEIPPVFTKTVTKGGFQPTAHSSQIGTKTFKCFLSFDIHRLTVESYHRRHANGMPHESQRVLPALSLAKSGFCV